MALCDSSFSSDWPLQGFYRFVAAFLVLLLHLSATFSEPKQKIDEL